MHDGRIIVTQLMDFLPRHEFNKCVHRYEGNSRNRGFLGVARVEIERRDMRLPEIFVLLWLTNGVALLLAANPESAEDWSPPELKQLIDKMASVNLGERKKAIDRIGGYGSSAVPAIPSLIHMLNDASELELADGRFTIIGRTAKRALVKIGAPAIKPCIAALPQSAGVQRRMLIEILGSSDERQAVDAIVSLLSHKDVEVRRVAAKSLHTSPGFAAIPCPCSPLVNASKDSDLTVRQEASAMLAKQHEPASYGSLIDDLANRGKNVRERAVKALGGMKDQRAIAVLLEIASDNDEDLDIRCCAARALGGYAEDRVEEELTRLLGPVGPVRLQCAAAGALGKIGGPRSLNSLMSGAEAEWTSSCTGEAILCAITEIEGGKAVPVLIRIAESSDEDWRLRFRAAVLAVKLTGGAIDSTKIVERLRKYRGSGMEAGDFDYNSMDSIHALQDVVCNGKTMAVRVAARNALSPHKQPPYWYAIYPMALTVSLCCYVLLTINKEIGES